MNFKNFKIPSYKWKEFDKLLLIMKFTIAILLISSLQVFAVGYGQRITLSEKNVPISKVFKEINRQTGYQFFYEDELVKNVGNISIRVKNAPLQEVLKICFRNLPLRYTISENTIVVTPAPTTIPATSFAVIPPPVEVNGTVVNANGKPLAGASIKLKDQEKGTVADSDGRFHIQLPENGGVLVISHIGYQTQAIEVTQSGFISVVLLDAESVMAAEVVVVGYGTKKRNELTGAISRVKAVDLTAGSFASVSESIQGKAAGVEVNSNSNSPGGSMSVRVRGIGSINNSIQPLYVVDGVPLSGDISFLNNNDIASVDVLKDASSAAIYGNRGANGVVMITTKAGDKNRLSISLGLSSGIQQATRLIKSMGVSEFAGFLDAFEKNDGKNSVPTVPATDRNKPGTNWLDETMNKNPAVNNYNLTISGGDDKILYSTSANYFGQQGIIKTSNYDRINLRLNTQFKITPKLTLYENILYAGSKRKILPFEGDLWNSFITNSITMDPLTPIYKTPAEVTSSPNQNEYSQFRGGVYTANSPNPVGMLYRNNRQETSKTYVGSVGVNYKILENFNFKSSFGFENSQYRYAEFNPNYYESSNTKRDVNNLTKNERELSHYVVTNTLDYAAIFKKSNFNFLLGNSFEKGRLQGIDGYTTNLPDNSPNFRYLNYGTSGAKVSEIAPNPFSLVSFFGRISYDFDKKYFLNASVRRDGSSKFGSGHQWGTFPAASASWMISNEPFMQNAIPYLKLRIGAGKIGNENIPPFAYDTRYRTNAGYNFGGVLNLYGYSILKLGTPNLTWEEATDVNLGVDFGGFKNKLTGSVDVYNRNINKLLLALEPAGFTGLYNSSATPGYYANVGQMRNRGIDIALNYDDKAGDFQYSVGTVFSMVRNKVVSLGSEQFIDQGDLRNVTNKGTRTMAGQSIGQFYGYKVLGIFQTQQEIDAYTRNGSRIQPSAQPGDFKFATNESNKNATTLNDNDRQFIGSSLPDFTMGLNLNLKYKGFSLAAYFYGAYGNRILEAQRSLYDNTNNSSVNHREGLLAKAWNGSGTSNEVPRITANSNNQNFSVVSDALLSDGSYLRLRNLNFGYDISPDFCKKMKMQALKFSVNLQNVFLITKYTGYDPAISNAQAMQTGVDFGGYPTSRIVMVGINATF